jgi:DNA polymerase III sliding clamp (beta) subunit (PCNA family)
MGVTLDAEEGKAVLYSTDNFTISRFETGDKLKLPGDAPVILPTFFCNQLLALARAFPKDDIDLVLIPGVLLAEFGKAATLMTKTLVDLEPLDFGRIIEKHCKLQAVAKNEGEIPAAFDAAISRASLVLSAEVDKAMRIKSLDSKSIHLHAESQQGVSDDEMQFAGSEADSFLVDPLLVARGLKGCTHMCISFPTVMVLRDESFTHVIAHCKG